MGNILMRKLNMMRNVMGGGKMIMAKTTAFHPPFIHSYARCTPFHIPLIHKED